MPKHKPSTWDATLGHRIRHLRLRHGLTQQDLARHLGCSYQMVQKKEIGTCRTSAEDAVRLAALFGLDLRQLLGVRVPPRGKKA